MLAIRQRHCGMPCFCPQRACLPHEYIFLHPSTSFSFEQSCARWKVGKGKKKEIFKPLSAWRWILSWQRATSTRIGRFCKLRFPWKSNDLLPSFRARKIRNSIACKFSSAIYFYSLSVTYLLIFARKRIAVYRKVNDRVLYGAVLHSKQWRHDAENRRQWKFNRKKAALFLRTWRRWLIRDRSNTSKVLMFCGIVRFIS